jgi:hypothetical protein
MVLNLWPWAAFAQTTSATITGTVRDTTGGVLPGARIVARHPQTGLQRFTTSDGQGRYALPGLVVGSWDVRAELAGFRPADERGIVLSVAQTSVVDLQLELGATETTWIVADVPLVDTSSGQLSYLVNQKAVQELPLNGRNYTDLALLQPGVVAFPHRDGGSAVAHGLGMSVNGQDPRSNVYMLDGTLMNDFTNGPAGSAAGTALGTETVQEFRVESNSYSAEFGRNSGGQINVITKSGTNDIHGSVYEFHRNDALDSRNTFDGPVKPEFRRNQYGATLGGPLKKDKTFFFLGYEGLRENLGRTIGTFVPDDNARNGLLPDPARPGQLRNVGVNPAVQPFLDAFPVANGASIGGGIAQYRFPFDQRLNENFFQARLDQNVGAQDRFFARYTRDAADQILPTDYPQFPRTFISSNQFFTAEYQRASSSRSLQTLRLGWSRTRIGQTVEANLASPLPPFAPTRGLVGDIDIGGFARFGPQSSADLSLRQSVYSAGYDAIISRGRHLLKAGALVERYVDDMSNPTFSLGIYTFPSLETFLLNRPTQFVGLTPDADIERNWRFTLFGGYLQDDIRVSEHLTLNAGVRYEYATLPVDTKGRDATLINILDRTETVGELYRNPGGSFSPRVGFAWDVTGDGRTALRGGYGLYYNTNNQQNLIVTVTNPPATPRLVLANPTFPNPPFERRTGISIRPVQNDLEYPRVHVWNVNVQRELFAKTVLTLGYAGARGKNLLRNTDANVPTPQTLPDGTLFFPATSVRPNPSYTTIEYKTSDGNSWYNALIVELRRASAGGISFQSSYTFSRNIDTTQASTFFSDATNGTTSAFPEFGTDYNKGLSDFHAMHNWVFNVTWDLPFARSATGLTKGLLGGWQLAAIGQVRSGPPLTLFVRTNRSRSRWAPAIGPGQGFDRPSFAPGRSADDAILGDPNQWFDPTAFVLQPAGTLGNLGRGALIGPDLRTLDLALVKRVPWSRLGPAGRLEFRVEAFNVFNRANFGVPSLTAFAGTADNEAPLPTLGRIRNTITSARQVQLGLRVAF